MENKIVKQENVDNPIAELIELLKAVDVNSVEAQLNATTISDGKGGRILL